MISREEISKLADELQGSRELLTALGDEMRQHIVLVMMQSGDCSGLRVNEIADKTSLSRPAVSHHLQILKNAGILKMRREGTKNYYYFDEDTGAIEQLIVTLEHAKKIMGSLPDRSGEDGWYARQ